MMRITALLFCIVGLGLLVGSGWSVWARCQADEDAGLLAMRDTFVREPTMAPFPKGNPYSPAKRALGERLFFDPILSKNNNVSCATCHDPDRGWEDGAALSATHRGDSMSRHTPTLLNVGWGVVYFWDGRAATLEAQALSPIVSDDEMAASETMILERLNADASYREAFEAVFPGLGVSLEGVLCALATFERTIVSGEAPFDRWVGGDETAISPSAKRGFELFTGKANCVACHQGWRFTDDGFHDIGLPDADRGRGAVMPGIEVLEHAFKTPTLRDVAIRAPYMHDGSLPSLEAVIEHYDGGAVPRRSLSAAVRPIGLSAQDKEDLVNFLHTLTEDRPLVTAEAAP
ncbi:MAG: cytochrome-c peroxidase [Maricaulaceae bacterium]